MVGFKIFIDEDNGDYFYSGEEEVLERWTKVLSKMIALKGFNEFFHLEQKLGKGGFSIIYEVERLSDKKHFAAKALVKKKFFKSDQKIFLENELRIMKELEH